MFSLALLKQSADSKKSIGIDFSDAWHLQQHFFGLDENQKQLREWRC